MKKEVYLFSVSIRYDLIDEDGSYKCNSKGEIMQGKDVINGTSFDAVMGHIKQIMFNQFFLNRLYDRVLDDYNVEKLESDGVFHFDSEQIVKYCSLFREEYQKIYEEKYKI